MSPAHPCTPAPASLSQLPPPPLWSPQLGSPFDADNRAGIDATLHRISALRSRSGGVVGLTCRVGRAVSGAAALAADLAAAGESILLLGPPGEPPGITPADRCRQRLR